MYLSKMLKGYRVFIHSPCKSTRAAARESQMLHMTAHQVFRKCFCLYAYKLQVMQAIMSDSVAHIEFVVTKLEKLVEDEFLRKIMFSDKGTFHVSRKVDKQNICIWGLEHPHAIVDHIRDSSQR